MGQKLNKIGFFVLSFVIPLAIMLLVLVGLHIAPFGDHTLIIMDSKALFVSDLSYFSRLVRGLEDFFCSFEWGLGLNLIASQGMMFDPINLLALPFDITNYATMYSTVVIVSVALCGPTMYWYLSSTYNNKPVVNLIFSTVYALIGYNVAYCFLYNFLLPVQLLPLIALGIRKIVAGKSPVLYLVSLGFGILTSFYFGYILCFGSATLFLMHYVEERKNLVGRKMRIWINIVVATICAGLFAAFIWVPALNALSGGRLNQNTIFDLTFNENMGILDTGAKLFVGSNNASELVNGLPNVFVGAFVLFLVIAYFVDSQNTTRSKIVRAVPLVAYYLTFYIKAFAMAMQGFSDTNWFNYRHSYVFSFIMILIAVEEFAQLRSISPKELKRACCVLVLFVVAVFSKQYEFITGGQMLLSILILALILGAHLWSVKDPKRAPQGQLATIILILCSIELYANCCISLYNLQGSETDLPTYQQGLLFGSVYSESIRETDNGFYRMENENPTTDRCSNDPHLFDYDGTSYFGSHGRTSMYQAIAKLGGPWYGNRTWYAEGEPGAYDSLMGLKYIAAKRDLAAEKGYESLLKLLGYEIYKNPNALPIGVLASAGQPLVGLSKDPFANHNALWSSLTGKDSPVFTEEGDLSFVYHDGADGSQVTRDEAVSYNASVSTAVSNVTAKDSGSKESASVNEMDVAKLEDAGLGVLAQSPYWIECTFKAKQDGPIYGYNGGLVADESGYVLEAMEYLGTYKAGDAVNVRIELPASVNSDQFKTVCAQYCVAYANDNVLAQYAKQLQEESGRISKVKDSHLQGELNASHDGRLLFTIPYDEGWSLTLDGMEVPLNRDADLFMSTPITAGSHAYELRFFPKGMKIGIALSCVGTLLAIALVVFDWRYDKRHPSE